MSCWVRLVSRKSRKVGKGTEGGLFLKLFAADGLGQNDYFAEELWRVSNCVAQQQQTEASGR
jgi:hypothetical protein